MPQNPQWKPAKDTVFLQEVGRRIQTDYALQAAAVLDDTLYVGSSRGVQRLDGNALVGAGGPKGAVRRLDVLNGALWALEENALWRYADANWSNVAPGAFTDLTVHLGEIVVASRQHLFCIKDSALVALDDVKRVAPILGVASHAETLYVRHSNRVGLLQDRRFEYDDVQDFGQLPLGATTRDMLSLGHRMLVATDRGLGELRGMTWTHLKGEDGLCYEDTTCLANGFADDWWIGTTRGAIRAVDGQYHYFGYGYWLPHDRVNAIACADRVAYIATDAGLGVIEYVPYTLRKKAAWYKQWLDQWGQKRLGFIHLLSWNGKRKEYVRFLNDNDLGWTMHYLNGLCFEYAVTKDPDVRREAVDVFRSVKWSEEITSIEGYPARSIHAVGQDEIRSMTASAGLPAEWIPTDDGKWEWKADTSSDEIIAHIYTTSVFLELVAQGKEKAAAAEHIRRIVGHIMGRGWVLRDLDGEPTRWGRWDPEYHQGPHGYNERGLNSLQALAMVATSAALTGDPRCGPAKKQLLAWGYHRDTLRQKIVFPDVTDFDDRLAFLAYYPLMRYETDPALRSIFRRSLERSWEIKRVENVPWYSFLYGALTGNACENPRAVDHLREWPLDCVNYRHVNSHRHDLQPPRGYRTYVADWKPLGPRDLGPRRWNRTTFRIDHGGSGGIFDCSGFLDAYWMARYYGFISAPDTSDPELIAVPPFTERRGAKPYTGPPRPDIFDF